MNLETNMKFVSNSDELKMKITIILRKLFINAGRLRIY